MKTINKTTLMLFALVLSLSVTVGATVAYFSDYEQASGGATLNLGGQTKLTEGSDSNQKDVVITNTGKTDMIVRVGIYGPDEMAAPTMTGDWIKSTKDGMYYYGKVLRPGEDTSASKLVASMTFNWELEDGEQPPDYYFEVTVVHEGTQAIYDGDTLIAPTNPDGSEYWDADVVAQIQPPVTE